MSEFKSAVQTDLERLLAELVSPDRSRRLDAIRRVTHVHQRPDLATVDALLEISYQMWRLAEAYEIVNAVEPRRQALEKAKLEVRIEERARHPPPPAPPPPLPRDDSYEANAVLSVRVYNALTRYGCEYHSKEEILEMVVSKIKNFGRVSFAELVGSLRRDKVSMHVIRASTLWKTAPQPWRDHAQACLEQWKQGLAKVRPTTDSQEINSSEALEDEGAF